MIVQGHKPLENRNWRSYHRGPLQIHAAKKWDQAGAGWIIEQFPHLEKEVMKAKELRGGIIGSVNMVDCVNSHSSPWFVGKWGFVFTDPEPMKFKPCPGRLSIFNGPGLNQAGTRTTKTKDNTKIR